MADVSLRDIFLNLQAEMEGKLALNRKIILHPGAKGEESELDWKEWLGTYLPKRYRVDKAFVIDSRGNQSKQIDIVIYDQQYTPFVFHGKGAIYIPAESVYAVLEVKQSLNSEYLQYAAESAESVRQLHRTSANIYDYSGQKPAKVLHEIKAGILSLDSDWNPTLGESFEKKMAELVGDRKLDFGCSLKGGAFVSSLDGDKVKIERSTPEESLIFFFLRLINELQKLGTVPAIDIMEYAKALDSID